MSDSKQPAHHGIDYVEIYATDVPTSRRFYEQVFDWQFTEYSPGYLGIKRAGGGESGGLCAAAEVPRGGPLVVLYSSDLEGTLQRLKQAGAVITKEPFAFPGGRRLQFLDPAGNELGVWTHS